MVSELVKKIMNLYLYGQEERSASLLSDSIIRPSILIPTSSIELDVNNFMSTGAGRFALGAQFAFIEEFLNRNSSSRSAGLQPGTYTKQQLFDEWGITTLQEKAWGMLQSDYRDLTDDYAERIYLFNTMSFQISDSALFIVPSSGGDRYIDSFAVLPTLTIQENFDFEGNGLAAILNSYLEPIADPSGIGRVVNINFTGTRTLINGYNQDQLNSEKDIIGDWNGLSLTKLAADGLVLMESLWDEGITKFLTAENKPILYGTLGNDVLRASKAEDLPTLEDYAENGTVLIAGDGNDAVIGGESADILIGGTGEDILVGGNGDILWGGEGPTGSVVRIAHTGDGEEDIFVVRGGETIKDADAADYVSFFGSLVPTGGVKFAPFEAQVAWDPKGFAYRLLDGDINDAEGGTLEVKFLWMDSAAVTLEHYNRDFTTHTGDAHIEIYTETYGPRTGNWLENMIKGYRAAFDNAVSDPLVLDMDGNGFDLRSSGAAGVYFDVEGGDFAHRVGWTSGQDGFLVRDLNSNGNIDSIAEMFGNDTISGFDALAAYDATVNGGNGDGKIDTLDSVWADLKIWQDLDGDGVTDSGELQSLGYHDIVSIDLTSAADGSLTAASIPPHILPRYSFLTAATLY